MLWDDEAFRERVRSRCSALGRSQRSVLAEAGLTPDFLMKPPQKWRQLDKLAKLCKPLQWSLAQVMGFDQRAASGEVSTEMMVTAMLAVNCALRGKQKTEDHLARAYTAAYKALAAHVAAGGKLDDSAISMLEASIRTHFGAGLPAEG